MRKTLIIALAFIASLSSFAQNNPFRTMGISATIGGQTLENKDANTKNEAELNVGLRFDFAKIKLHKGLIGDMLRINLDAGLDLNFAKYKKVVSEDNLGSSSATTSISKEKIGDWDPMQGEIGIAIGPSIQIAPVSSYRDLQVSAFYHVIPSASVIVLDNEVSGAFNPFMSFGAGISWKFIGVGYEHRWGSAKYKDYNKSNKTYGQKIKYDTTADNFYLKFMF